MKKTKSHLVLLVLVVFLAVFLSGCYTLLKHPRVAENERNEDYRNCAACHGQFIHPSPYDMYYYRGIWSDYYFFPWWYNAYLGNDDVDYFYTAPEREIIKRNVTRPDGLRNLEEGMGTTRARVKSSDSLGGDKAFDRQKNSNTKVKESSTKTRDTLPSKRNIIRRKNVKDKRKENPKKK